jgi:molybdopterin converting factor small subunit
MAKLRLFATLREAAGSAVLEIDGTTVGEIIDTAAAQHGPAFEAAVPTAKVWVNGEPADRDHAVRPGDEVALLPPVSGGSQSVAEPSTQAFQAVLALALVGVMVLASYVTLELFVFITVGAALFWLWDITEVATARGERVNVLPTLITVVTAANGAFSWGFAGFAGGLVIGTGVTLAWSIFAPAQRNIEGLALSTLVALAGGAAAGSLVLVRMRTVEEITAFILIAVAGTAAAWAALRFTEEVPWLDANVALVAAAAVTGLVAGLVSGVLSTTGVFIAALAAGAGLIAGRVLGSMVRTGTVLHTVRAPGLLTMFDGAVVAAPLFWLALAVFA